MSVMKIVENATFSLKFFSNKFLFATDSDECREYTTWQILHTSENF